MKLLPTAALVIASALLTAGTVVGATTATAAPERPNHTGSTRVIGDCVHPRFDPRKVVSACADGDTFAVVTRYESWTGHRATGVGRLVVNDCKPTCVAGHFHRYPATFRLHRVVRTANGPLFSRLGVTYVKGGEQHDVELSLPTRSL